MDHREAQSLTPPLPRRRDTVRLAAIITVVVLGILAIGILSWQLAPVLLLVFGAALVAIFLRSLAEWTAKRTNLSYGWSLGGVVMLLLVITAIGIYTSGQPVADQMATLSDEVPQSVEKLREEIGRYRWGESLLRHAPTSTKELPLSRKDMASYASEILFSVTGGLAAAFVVVFLALYMSIDHATYVEGAVRLIPMDKRRRVREALHEVHETLRWWLLGKVVSMVLVGVLTSGGLWLLGVPLAIALGVIAALLTFIPNFGPVLSAVPAVLLAFVDSPTTALNVIFLYLAIQTVESYLITPLIQQRTASLPPALTISAQVGLGLLFGAPGVVLATPLTAMALVLVRMLYIEDALEHGLDGTIVAPTRLTAL